jgi:hypothetical protein
LNIGPADYVREVEEDIAEFHAAVRDADCVMLGPTDWARGVRDPWGLVDWYARTSRQGLRLERARLWLWQALICRLAEAKRLDLERTAAALDDARRALLRYAAEEEARRSPRADDGRAPPPLPSLVLTLIDAPHAPPMGECAAVGA